MSKLVKKGDLQSGACFSECEKYRYALWRRFTPSLLEEEGSKKERLLMWLMLNPSTADESKNDPTIERCERRAIAMGFDGIYIANIFAWRSTDPEGLKLTSDPVGPCNDAAIIGGAYASSMIICGWGKHGGERGRNVCKILRTNGYLPYALEINKDGSPKHPLYIGYDKKPIVLPQY